jgi:hypothetical protein
MLQISIAAPTAGGIIPCKSRLTQDSMMPPVADTLLIVGFVLAVILLPVSYMVIKWRCKDPESWAAFEFDSQLRPEDLRFNALVSNFIIGKREMPYPVYRELSHLSSSFQEWLSGLPVDRDTQRTYHGSVESVIFPSDRRKIFSACLTTLKISSLLGLPLCTFFGITFSTHKAVFYIWFIILIGVICMHTYCFNAWSASRDGVSVGRWFFKVSIPWSDISSFEMGLPEFDKSGSRVTMFIMRLQFGDKTAEMRDGKFKSLYPIYQAISAFRPDLALSADVDK